MSARPLTLEPPVSAAMPERLGKYPVVKVIGEGAMGVVYKGLDPHIGRPVALKAIRAPLLAADAQDLSAATRFRTEAQAAGRLSHPNIVSVYEYGESGDGHYIAMEFVEGTSLLELLAAGRRLPLDDALSVMLQLLDALACAHAQGIWHRDIKPANLLVTPDGRLKVTDFGIARIESSDRTHHSTVLGSPGYMAPERYTDEQPDQRVDIFSCGVLLYELLTGAAPFRGSSSAVMYQVLSQDPAPPSSLDLQPAVPARLDAVVARALAKRAAERYDDAAQMREALCEAADRPIPPTLSVATRLRLREDQAAEPTQAMPRARTGSSNSSSGMAAADLDRVEALLLPQVGPMARWVVRDAARRSADLASMLARLADEVLEPAEGEAFLAQARAVWPTLRRTAPAPQAAALPVLGQTPLPPEVIGQAERLLADQIGPIASLMVRRAAAGGPAREQFFAALADMADDEVNRKDLLAALWRLA